MARATERPLVGRRAFFGLAAAAPLGLWPGRGRAGPAQARPAGAAPPAEFERQHRPRLTLPPLTSNGGKVPILVEMDHPMTPGHHVRRIEVLNRRDPVASKGVFHLGPGNGAVHVAWQARLSEGVSEVEVVAECNRHGRFTATRVVDVAPGGGGCGVTPAAARRPGGDDVRAPVLRIAELVERGAVRRDEVVHLQVKLRHPNRDRLPDDLDEADEAGAGDRAARYLVGLEVALCGEVVSRFDMTRALAEDPFITLAVRAGQEGPLAVRLFDNRGGRLEAVHELRLA